MISVIIPAKDADDTLTAQLDALAAQTYAGEWEVVIADNGSFDRTVPISENHRGLAGRIRVVPANEQAGPAFARNAGAAAASGDRLLFCDADDVVCADWIKVLNEALDEHELVGGPYELYALNPVWLAESRGRQRLHEPQMWGEVRIFAAGNLGVHRTTFAAIGGFDPTFIGHEDHELALRFHVAGIDFHHCPEAVVHYRYRAEPGALFRQGLHYGRSHPAIVVAALSHGMAAPPRVEWRPWGWLVVNLPKLRHPEGRLRYLWVVAVRIGRITGSIHGRTFYI